MILKNFIELHHITHILWNITTLIEIWIGKYIYLVLMGKALKCYIFVYKYFVMFLVLETIGRNIRKSIWYLNPHSKSGDRDVDKICIYEKMIVTLFEQ